MKSIVFKQDFLSHDFVCCGNFFPSHSALSLFSVICKTPRLITYTDYFNSSSSSRDRTAWEDAIHYCFYPIINARRANLVHDFFFPAQFQCHQDATLPKIKYCTITWKGKQRSMSLRWTFMSSSSVHGRRVASCSVILHVFPTFTKTSFSLYTYWYSTFKI